jgi:ribosomal protein S18 acetylase RimI-like enzyme
MSANEQQQATPAVRLLEAAAGDDAALVERLAALVNEAYAAAERGLWRDGWSRTRGSDLAELIRARELAVAVRQARVVGCIRVRDLADDAGEFGLLASASDRRGMGIGRALVAFAEEHGRGRGLRAMRLELLVPREWRHPDKELLRAWYSRLGYLLIGTADVAEPYPHLVPLLATPCDIETYEKPLLR